MLLPYQRRDSSVKLKVLAWLQGKGLRRERDRMSYTSRARISRVREVIVRDLKLILVIVLILTTGAAVNLIFYNSEAEINEIINRPRESRYSIALKGNKATGINDRGEIVWQISAKLVTVSAREDEYEFHDAIAHFFDASGPNLRMEVGKIIYYERTKNLDLFGGVRILTRDNMMVETERIHWVHYASQFVFPEHVTLVTKDGNWIAADYLQGDKELRQLTFVGNCQVKVSELKDTKFIQERKLTTADLKLQDFKDVFIHADMVIYDKDQEVMVALSDFSDKVYEVKPPLIMNPITGERVMPPKDDNPTQLYFKKGEIEIWANHVEVHMKDSWAKCYGNVAMRINPSQPKEKEDPALKAMRKRTTLIKADDIEYFWDVDYARTYGRSIVVQDDRRAGSDGITYFGKYNDPDTGQVRKVVFLDDNIYLYQKSGEWMKEDQIVKDFKNPDVEKMIYEEIKLTANRSVIFLDSNDIFAEGIVRIRQRDKAAQCSELFFDDQKKKFTCQAGVEYWNKKDEHFVGEQIIFFTDKDDIEVNGRSDSMIRIPEKYLKEFDDVERKIKQRGAKGTTDEEAEAKRQEEIKKWREENPPWEFLPDWEDVVNKTIAEESPLAIPEPPAPEVDISAFDWLTKLSGRNLAKPPWDSENETSVGNLVDKLSGGLATGTDESSGGETGINGEQGRLLPPEGVPIAPPQVTGLAGDDAVRQALGVTEEPVTTEPGEIEAPVGGEFLPPPDEEGFSEIEQNIKDEGYEIIITPKKDGETGSRIKKPPPPKRKDDSENGGSKGDEGGGNSSSSTSSSGAIVIRPPKEGD
jgi:LPS export ABC transporter protein LptC